MYFMQIILNRFESKARPPFPHAVLLNSHFRLALAVAWATQENILSESYGPWKCWKNWFKTEGNRHLLFYGHDNTHVLKMKMCVCDGSRCVVLDNNTKFNKAKQWTATGKICFSSLHFLRLSLFLPCSRSPSLVAIVWIDSKWLHYKLYASCAT